ncbi:MAG: TlpA family protein disulfide reductase [Hyphomonadaceae bacterium]|nr:TlpA family protein disulfide reductase [Hyphomonadaceae bacterium]
MNLQLAKPLETVGWLNSLNPVSLQSLRGKVVLIEAFQMLCPGCVSNALPQAMRVRQLFNEEDVAVIGLHTVFEHHSAQGTKPALEAFLHEYRISFPVGIDAPSDQGPLPKTMTAYQMRGTPTSILIDRNGFVRKHKFGSQEDMVLGAEIMALLREPTSLPIDETSSDSADAGCTEDGCGIGG